ncbi:gp5 C-terminal domain protein, partial [Vibrio parahaemolyticus V-223/04]
MHRA